MKTNKKIAILALCVSVALTGCGGKSTAEYIESGDELVAKQDTGNAAIEYKNALKSDPKNAEVRYKLGILYLSMGDMINAEKELDKALRLKFDEVKVAPGLARVKFELNKFHDLYPLTSINFGGNKDAEIATLFYASVAAIRDGKGERANEFLKRSVELDKDNSHTLLIDAWMTFAYTKKPEVALAKVNYVLKQNENLDYAIFLKGLVLQLTEKHDEAAEQFAKYIEINPKSSSTEFYLIKSLIEAEKLVEAETRVDKMLANNAKHPLINLFKAQILFKNKDFKQALNSAGKVILYMPDSESAKIIAGVSAFKEGLYQQAYNNLSSFEKSLKISSLNRIMAVTRLKLGYEAEAADMIVNAEDITDKDIEILQIASAALAKKGNVKKAEDTIDRAIETSPENARLLAQKGIVELSKDNELGIDLLKESLKLDPALSGARLALAMQFIEKGEFDKAINVANEWEKVESDWVLAQLLKGTIAGKQEDFGKAEAIYKSVLDKDAANLPALFNLGQLSERLKKKNKAVTYYKKLLTEQPDHMPSIGRLTSIGMENSKQSDILDFMLDLKAKNPDNVNLIMGIAFNYELRKQFSKAVRVLKTIQDKKNLPDAYFLVLSNIYMKDSNEKKGIETLVNLIKSSPNNYDARISYLTLLEKEDHFTAGQRAVKEALVVFTNDPRLMIFQIHFEMAMKDFDQAEILIKQYLAKHNNNLVIKKFEAKISSAMNRLDESEALYSELYEEVPSNDNAKNLARVLYKAGKKDNVAVLLSKHLEKDSEDDSLRSMLAGLYIDIDAKKSAEQYSILIKKQPKNVAWLNNAAMAEIKLGDNKTALMHAEKAYYLAPSNFNVIDTYAKALFINKKLGLAIEMYESAIRKGAKGTQTYLNLVELYQSERQYKKAKELIAKIDSATIKDDELKEKYKTLLNRM